MTQSQAKRIEKAFTHHPPRDDSQTARYAEIRRQLRELAAGLCNACPDSRELNSALKCLEEAQSWAIAAIARNE